MPLAHGGDLPGGEKYAEFPASSETQSSSYTISTISFKFNKRMFLALMRHKPLADQSSHPPVALSGNQVKWPNPNNDNRGIENRCMRPCRTK